MNDYTNLFLSFFWIQFILTTILGLICFSFLDRILKRIGKYFSVPKRVKTQNGYLYRSLNGEYVEKEVLEYVDVAYIFKNKESGIKHLERRLQMLKQSSDKLKEQHKHYFDTDY
ncbi:MAG: hypothetical protein RR370_03180 [Synergistaceae bacterium]